jgi:HSP20 family protein
MGIVCQDSDSGHDKVSKHLDSLMDELMGQSFTRLVSSGAWEPQWNIYEVSDEYVVCVDLAGTLSKDIDVQVDRGSLKISGYREKPDWPHSDLPSVHAMEIDWGRFERSLALPAEVDQDRVTAHYRHGYLWIIIPKKTEKG